MRTIETRLHAVPQWTRLYSHILLGSRVMQMDLFAEVPRTSAAVMVFPVNRRIAQVRDVVRELGARDYLAGRKFWNAHVKALRAQLRAIGIPRRQVDEEIRRYSAAVARAVDHSLHVEPPSAA